MSPCEKYARTVGVWSPNMNLISTEKFMMICDPALAVRICWQPLPFLHIQHHLIQNARAHCNYVSVCEVRNQSFSHFVKSSNTQNNYCIYARRIAAVHIACGIHSIQNALHPNQKHEWEMHCKQTAGTDCISTFKCIDASHSGRMHRLSTPFYCVRNITDNLLASKQTNKKIV